MGVVDAVRRSCFAEHPGAEMSLAAEVGPDELHGDDAVDEDVARSVHDPHAAFANARLKPVAPSNHPIEGGVLPVSRT